MNEQINQQQIFIPLTQESTTINPTFTTTWTSGQIGNAIVSRFRSRLAWTTTIGLVLFVLKTYFSVEIPKVNELVNYLLITATAVGIFNNPTNPDGY